MSDKLLSYLDMHPSVVSVWVNPDLLYTTGPVAGFEKVTRDEALQLCINLTENVLPPIVTDKKNNKK